MEYVPWRLVVVVVVVPFTMTATPERAVPCSLVTFPVTVFCCADACAAMRNSPTNTMSGLVFIWRVPGFGVTCGSPAVQVAGRGYVTVELRKPLPPDAGGR